MLTRPGVALAFESSELHFSALDRRSFIVGSGNLYIGATKKLEKRYAEHRAGSAGRTTSLDPPVSLVYA